MKLTPLRFISAAGTLALGFCVYAFGAYFYTQSHVRPVKPQTAPSQLKTPVTTYRPDDFLFVHQTNTPTRVIQKSEKFNNFELDVYSVPTGDAVYVAHDQNQLKNSVQLRDIFAALTLPNRKNYWVDMKTNLTQAQIDEIKELAQEFHIDLKRLIFEPPNDEQALLLRQNGLNVIIQVLGFDQRLTARQTQELVQQTEARIKRIEPIAISAGMGQYPALKTYFPHVNKALCYNTTKRPSLKKYFMWRLLRKDKTVSLFLIDEYDWDR